MYNKSDEAYKKAGTYKPEGKKMTQMMDSAINDFK
jgi:hypothetical protein